METEVLSTMAAVLTSVGSIVTAAIGWIGDYLTMITTTGNELMLLFTLIPFVGLGIGLLKRMISL